MDHLDADTAHRLIAGLLDPATAEDCKAHVRHCAACRALVDEERALQGLLDLAGDVELPNAKLHLERTLARAAEVPLRGQRHVAWARWSGWAAVLILAAGLAGQLAAYASGSTGAADRDTIPPGLQQRVVRHLDALAALESDPWLVHEYEAVETLSLLIDGPGPR